MLVCFELAFCDLRYDAIWNWSLAVVCLVDRLDDSKNEVIACSALLVEVPAYVIRVYAWVITVSDP